jgi:hypothetical protein
MKLPLQLDAEEFFTNWETLQDWADDNAELFSDLILEGCEVLAYTEAATVTVLSIGVPGVMGAAVELDLVTIMDTVQVNESHWVDLEDYARAARARDASEYIKKRLQHVNTSD